ncbi:luciferase family oxidoreductase group 1 [Pontibacter ummariensis]|uniref:Luciferase-like monooxygenase n=1 Tax=Pontibacter ummariensis TaxID=1610492 RepID=A0A239KVC0_9BACT|nr:LLM class flavin-dependent oxidoreductase [Pontibacter ummariensis]PRY05039.1 luciferase family oxidoreductase group 1 [Pontibacter ummariensis]SNT21563.1 luciferase family oxidoreductase, group 1 [Pontibacter ummariensis]
MNNIDSTKGNGVKGTRRGNAPVPLSILDFVVTGKGYSAIEALEASLKLARLVDRRGFTRYWVAEHHAMPGVATSSPPILLSRLIGETRQIRLGSGGMMLPNFPPLVVAEQFGLLEALAPGRIDLGLGRAPGTDGYTATALRRGNISVENFPEQLEELFSFLDDDFPEDDPYIDKVYAVPGPGQDRENGVSRSFQHPPVWLLGSSGYSAKLAGQRGLPFAFAAQLAPENLMMAFEIYRKNFKPSHMLEKPYAMVCFGVFAAEDENEAYRQSRSFAHSMMRMMYRKSYVLPSPEEVEDYQYDELELRTINMWNNKVLYGTPEQVVEKLNHYQETTQADELMILNLGHSPSAIFRSAELIADAYEMPDLTT